MLVEEGSVFGLSRLSLIVIIIIITIIIMFLFFKGWGNIFRDLNELVN